jgi:hypothetical protein
VKVLLHDVRRDFTRRPDNPIASALVLRETRFTMFADRLLDADVDAPS